MHIPKRSATASKQRSILTTSPGDNDDRRRENSNLPIDTVLGGVYGRTPRVVRERQPAGSRRMILKDVGSSEDFLQTLPYGCLGVDLQGIIRMVNPAALRLLSLETHQLLERRLLDAIPAWQKTPLADTLGRTLAGQETEPLEYELPAPQERTLHVTVTTLPDSHSHQPTLMLFLVDATELVRLKQRLRWTEYQASIGKLARGIAHELNNPLDGVLRYTHLALQQATEDSPVREHLVHVKEGLDRMVRAVRAFLEFSRQAVAPVNRAADLNRLIEDALLLVKHRAKFQNIQIIKQLHEGLPPVVDGGIQHAVVNLVKNAFDAMPRGGTLTISTSASDGMVELAIADTGSGIPDDIRERVFEPFFSTKPIHQGSGLGLIITKEVVERSGGTISFTSASDAGTTFVIHIPAASGDATCHGA